MGLGTRVKGLRDSEIPPEAVSHLGARESWKHERAQQGGALGSVSRVCHEV